MFIHTVYFWLNEGTPDDARQRMVNDCEDLLSEIPGVQHVWSGRPAMTPREVVDNSYDVGLCVALHDAKAHDVYQTHERHQEFIRRYKQHWKRVQVYDFHRGS